MLDQLNDNDELKEWNDCFFNNAIKVIDPSDSRLEAIKQNNQPVQFYSFNITSIEGLSKCLQETELNGSIQVRLSLIDMTYKQFFGRTWMGPLRKLAKNDANLLNYDEIVYLATPIRDFHVLIVIEVAVKVKNEKIRSLGWVGIRPVGSSHDSTYTK